MSCDASLTVYALEFIRALPVHRKGTLATEGTLPLRVIMHDLSVPLPALDSISSPLPDEVFVLLKRLLLRMDKALTSTDTLWTENARVYVKGKQLHLSAITAAKEYHAKEEEN